MNTVRFSEHCTVRARKRQYALGRLELAAIAKHVSVLERAGLVAKERVGKEKVVRLVPETIQAAEAHLSEYEKLWAARYDALEELLEQKQRAKHSSPKMKPTRD